ncbi:Reverse transcriptase (RNA-dependent DNA polymerase) [Popillia japonica]|uniref:Reverse transcriptase (RNA-dependent DNA polymerase) n=1 Tax=Popillia japonica TaxID=7064 RepID=A0AAW1KHB1_POPJA
MKWFKKEELEKAAQSLRSRKAPGIDGVFPEVIKRPVALAPEVLLRLMNELLAKQTFPKQWKETKLVLIPKSKPEDMKFRPICLLSSSSKLCEALLKDRLEQEIEEREGISESQFSCRKGRSTIHAVEKVLELLHENTTARWWALNALDDNPRGRESAGVAARKYDCTMVGFKCARRKKCL